ncbi:MAG TPA: diguanylate cyclase [Blastocatellia bacterium]|nr:diguanylate cyclase [Blastocatellia bacterium]
MKILIAEDDVVSRLVLQRTLERWGHEVISTTNGEEAWNSFLAESCRMVITDWMMPETDGTELCRRIRSIEDHEYTYIILLTAKSQTQDLVQGMNAGADDFISKPFDRSELEVRVRAGERVLQLEQSLRERTLQIQNMNYQLCRRVQRENSLNQLLSAVNQSLDPGVVLRVAARQLQELFEASRAFIMFLTPDGQSLQAVSEDNAPGVRPLGSQYFPLTPGPDGQEGHEGVLVVEDLRGELERQPDDMLITLTQDYDVRSLLSAPISHQGKWLGIVGLHQCHQTRRWEEDEKVLVEAMAKQMGVAISHAQLYEQLQDLAVRDGLTGLYNRRYFDQTLSLEFERARRFGHPLSLVMIDLDYLKKINDNFGHQSGDTAIRRISEAVNSTVRRVDIAARYGGEEFGVLMVETQPAGASAAAEGWRKAINQCSINGHYLSASFGVATFPQHADTPEDLIKAADEALYRAKREGRNRVCVAGAAEPATQIGWIQNQTR